MGISTPWMLQVPKSPLLGRTSGSMRADAQDLQERLVPVEAADVKEHGA